MAQPTGDSAAPRESAATRKSAATRDSDIAPARGSDIAPARDSDSAAAQRWEEVAEAAAHAFRLLPARPEDSPPGGDHRAYQRLNTDRDTVERDLMKLVLTLVELLRQLMERQALHRVDQGDLTEDQEERIGATLMILHDRMTELCARYDLSLKDLNIDLGPLGPLLPPS